MRRLPPLNRRMTTVGRQVLAWESHGAEHRMEMRDAWRGEALWTHKFAANSKAAIISQDVVGVLQPDGQFILVSLADGKLLTKEQLEPETSLSGIFLLRFDGGYLLLTNAVPRADTSVTAQPIPNGSSSIIANGRLYAFDQIGKKLWPAPVVLAQQGLLLSQPSELPVLVFVAKCIRGRPCRSANSESRCCASTSGRAASSTSASSRRRRSPTSTCRPTRSPTP